MRCLLDTNICIYVIKKKPLEVFERFRTHQVGDLGISVITYSELAFGVANSKKRRQDQVALDGFLAPLEIVPYHPDVAPVYGDVRAHLQRRGQPIGALDLLIAAHALYLGSVLVTNNVDEFSRVPDLTVENWVG